MVVAASAISSVAAGQNKSAARFYQPELDALRLAAFLMVWVSHSLPSAAECLARGIGPRWLWWIEAFKDAGNFGVCVFFFLSAYLITELLRRERELTGTVHLRAFYVRRILRIWPLYLGVLGVYGLLGLRYHGFRIEPGRLLASVLLAGNWYIAVHPAILTPMRALWSLSVEEQFYLGWPLLARLAGPFGIGATCAGLIAMAGGVIIWLAREGGNSSMMHVTAWVNSLVQFQYFALGALGALLLKGRVPQVRGRTRAVMLSIAAAAMLTAAGVCGIKRAMPLHSASSMIAGYALAGLGSALLFGAVLGVEGRWIPRWAIRLGKISFGLYVFHETGFFFADVLEKHLLPREWSGAGGHWALALVANKSLSLIFTVLMAVASYRYWERPFLRFKGRFTFVASRNSS